MGAQAGTSPGYQVEGKWRGSDASRLASLGLHFTSTSAFTSASNSTFTFISTSTLPLNLTLTPNPSPYPDQALNVLANSTFSHVTGYDGVGKTVRSLTPHP